jgi:hypothetical protein
VRARHTQPFRLLTIGLLLILTTALPWLASMLLTDIFAGLAVLSLFILVLHGEKISTLEKSSLFAFTGFAAAAHSATLGVLWGLCCCGFVARPLLGKRIALTGLLQGSRTVVAGAATLVSANFALSDQWAWTPGGYGVAFGRMLQDGIVAQYRRDHCATEKLKLCPYRNELPHRRRLPVGRQHVQHARPLSGLSDEIGHIAARSLAATAHQLVDVATGEGTIGWLPHTYGIIERYIPRRSSRCTPHFGSTGTSGSLRSTGCTFRSRCSRCCWSPRQVGHAIYRRRFDDLALLAITVSLALSGNAVICGGLSGPHDRYGARIVWIATFTVLIAAARYLGDEEEDLCDQELNQDLGALRAP